MEEHAIKGNTSVSIATNTDENGELIDYVDVSVVDSYVETEKVTKASFILRGINHGEYFDVSCFYQDGKRVSNDVHESGIVEL